MKRLLFIFIAVSFISFHCSSCGPKDSTGSSNTVSDIDRLIAQHDQDMDQSNDGHQAFKRVLQSLKDGTMDINDAFIRSGTRGGEKCDKGYKWSGHVLKDRPEAWQTFLIHIVEYGSTPGDHIPYFEYAKANNADFKVWDMYGRSLVHLVLASKQAHTEKDLAWLLENTEAKELINTPKRTEGDPESVSGTEGPWSTDAALQTILKKHGSSHTG
jgi:hypothetical protein